jgi:hypothetical protein
MSMHRARHTGLILCAIALLVASCTSSGTPTEGPSPVPTGIADGGQNGKGKGDGGKHQNKPGKHHNKPGKHQNKPGGGSSSSSAAPRPSGSSSPAPGGHTSTRPAPTHSSTRPGGGGHTSRPPQSELPRVTVTPSTGLASVQTVTVEGFNFKPNTLLAVAECHDRGLDTSLPDCNINNVITYAPGLKVHSDANGHVGPVQLTVRKTFKAVNCATMKCLVAISEPALRPDPADEGDQYIHFA